MNESHATTLQAKHARIDNQILTESHRPSPDETVLSMLKKQKLKLKEALSRLR